MSLFSKNILINLVDSCGPLEKFRTKFSSRFLITIIEACKVAYTDDVSGLCKRKRKKNTFCLTTAVREKAVLYRAGG